MRKLEVVSTVLVGFFLVSRADAAVLYDTVGSLTSFAPSSGWVIRDYRPTWQDATQFAAMPFTLSQKSYVTGVELALTALAGWSGNYSVQILADESSLPGATPLWTASSLQSAPVFQPPQTYSFTSVSGSATLLESDTKYWLYVACASNCELSWWASASSPMPGAIQYNSVFPHDLRWAISESNAAMFRVTGNVSAVPEPASGLLFASGLAALAIRSARNRGKNGKVLEDGSA